MTSKDYDIQKIRRWKDLPNTEGATGELEAEVIKFLEAHLPPETMADVEWNDDEHFLAEAEGPYRGTYILIDGDQTDLSEILCADENSEKCYANRESLTLTGRRYKLVLDEESEPDTVSTEEEYEALPEGSIVASGGFNPLFKDPRGVWNRPGLATEYTNWEVKDVTRRVLRRGWGNA